MLTPAILATLIHGNGLMIYGCGLSHDWCYKYVVHGLKLM